MISAILSLVLSLQSGTRVTTTAQVQADLRDPAVPSCRVMEDRLQWMRKQAAEFDRLVASGRTLTVSQQQEIAAFRKRWLSLNEDLAKPWADLTVQFDLSNWTAPQLAALGLPSLRIDVNLLGRHWTAPVGSLPPDWTWAWDASEKVLTLRVPATVTEYCDPEPSAWDLELSV